MVRRFIANWEGLWKREIEKVRGNLGARGCKGREVQRQGILWKEPSWGGRASVGGYPEGGLEPRRERRDVVGRRVTELGGP